MEIRLMRRPRRLFVLAALVALTVALMLALLGSGGGLPTPARAAVHHAKHAVHHAKHHARSAQSEPTNGSDGDSVQSGDQTTPDPAGETSGESESTTESELGQPGEPANGHADPPGQSNHECTGNCVE